MDKKIYKNSTLVKVKMLSYGFRMIREVEELMGGDVKEEHRGYGDSNWGIKKATKVPCEIMLPGEIVVATHIRQDSPLRLELDNDKLVITENNKKISDAHFLSRPGIWSEELEDGKNMKKIGNFYGRDCLNFNIYSGCEFWDVGLPCAFCSVKPTQEKYGEVKIKKTASEVRQVVKRAFKIGDRVDFILVTGGSYLDGKKEVDMMVPVLQAIREELPKSWGGVIKGNAAIMSPQNTEKVDELMATGIEHPAFNLEVWGRELFNDVCPGKAKHRGWDHMIKIYKYAVERYGGGVFWVNFVGGLNRLEDLKEGFSIMAKMGVVPGANIFHPDVGSVLGARGVKSPSPEYIIELYRHAAKLYHKYNYLPFFNEKCLRNSLANEAYLGYI